MIVKCIKEDRHGHLGLNRTYFVHGIQYEEGRIYYWILPFEDDIDYNRFNSEYFQVIDETVPTNWKFGMHRGFFWMFYRILRRAHSRRGSLWKAYRRRPNRRGNF